LLVLLGRLLLGTLGLLYLVERDLLGGCHLIVRDRIYDIRRHDEFKALHWDDIHTHRIKPGDQGWFWLDWGLAIMGDI